VRKVVLDNMEQRREVVARLRLRGLSTREISAKLMESDICHPNGSAWSYVTIASDIKALAAEWRRQAEAVTGEHIGRQFAQIQEAMRAAWKEGDLSALIRLMDREAKLLGLDAPEKHAYTGELTVGHRDEDNPVPAVPASTP
jgi:hypothetical protein